MKGAVYAIISVVLVIVLVVAIFGTWGHHFTKPPFEKISGSTISAATYRAAMQARTNSPPRKIVFGSVGNGISAGFSILVPRIQGSSAARAWQEISPEEPCVN